MTCPEATTSDNWPWSVLSEETVAFIRATVATWPVPSTAQIDQVAALRPSRRIPAEVTRAVHTRPA
ncbi:hypothetical protein JNUCC0626_19790 [Lentzea sp. JNUCC 0626]|uniref:hypothetical protein n=1 Tax=Lentzea sp. JNUCC 0626 TaxID=3367513 RepID=UPI0037479E6F